MDLPHRLFTGDVQRLYRDLLAADVGGGNGGVPAPHAASHGDGGSDALDLTTLAGFSGNATDVLHGDGTWSPPSAFTPSYYHGYHTASFSWSSTTWSGVHNVLTLTDVDQVGITRSNSDFTVDDDGDYAVDVRGVIFKSGTGTLMGFRLLLNGAEIAQGPVVATNNASQLGSPTLFYRAAGLVAGDVLTVEYCTQAATGTFGGGTLGSEAARLVTISINRVA